MIIPYLEVEITDHCNLRCANCTHHSPYMDAGFYPLEQFREDVANLGRAAKFDSIRVMGGEPLLNPEVVEYVKILCASGMFEHIGMATNGTLLDRADPELFHLLDFIDVLLYPTPAQQKVAAEAARIAREFPGLMVNRMSPGHFWQEDFQGRIEDGRIVERIWRECGMKFCNAIYQGYYVQCVQTYRKPKFMQRLGVRDERLEDWRRDAVKLDSPRLEERLQAFLGNRQMPEACNWCLGQSGKDITHHQQPLGKEIGFFSRELLKW